MCRTSSRTLNCTQSHGLCVGNYSSSYGVCQTRPKPRTPEKTSTLNPNPTTPWVRTQLIQTPILIMHTHHTHNTKLQTSQPTTSPVGPNTIHTHHIAQHQTSTPLLGLTPPHRALVFACYIFRHKPKHPCFTSPHLPLHPHLYDEPSHPTVWGRHLFSAPGGALRGRHLFGVTGGRHLVLVPFQIHVSVNNR